MLNAAPNLFKPVLSFYDNSRGCFCAVAHYSLLNFIGATSL